MTETSGSDNMKNEVPRPPEMPPEISQPAVKRKTALYIGVVLAGIIVIVAIIAIASNPPLVAYYPS